MQSVETWIIGRIEPPLGDLRDAPLQADEGAPSAWVVLDAALAEGARDLEVGTEIELLTWLHRADRDVLKVHPRGDRSRLPVGVFSARSPHRPNPIGLHRVTVVEVREDRIRVDALEAVDGTPVLDIKPVLATSTGGR